MPMIHVPIRDFAKIKGFIQQSIGFGGLECNDDICHIKNKVCADVPLGSLDIRIEL